MDFLLGLNFGLASAVTALALAKQSNMSANIWLAAIGALVAASMILVFAGRQQLGAPNFLVAFASSSLFLLLPALMLLYVRTAAGRMAWYDYLWLTPALIHFAMMFVVSNAAGGFQFVNGFVVTPADSFIAAVPSALPVLFGVICPIVALREAARHEHIAKEALSTLTGVDLRWAGQMQIIALVGAGISVLALSKTGGAPSSAPFIALTIIAGQLAAICVFVVRQRPTPPIVITAQQHEAHPHTSSQSDETLHHLEMIMQTKKPHLKEGLNIEGLAEATGRPRQTISNALKIRGQSFYDFINSWRVVEAKKLLADETLQDISILSLAYDAGFSSKATFNRVFKTEVGSTPREFRANCLHGKNRD